jgi:KUP system potassium uptake protein
MVILATAATIIASQAVISGVFSMTQQALQLGFLPRMRILQTSKQSIGQIYVPVVNVFLCVATIILVAAFRSSDGLAGAYGIAVVCTMLITTVLFCSLMGKEARAAGRRPVLLVAALPLLAVDVLFLIANTPKIPEGGWFPLLCALVVFVIMRTWIRGRRVLLDHLHQQARSLGDFLTELRASPAQIVRGTAVFMSADMQDVPRTLTRNVRSNGVLHEHTILMSVVTERVPRVARSRKLVCTRLSDHLWRVEARLGFSESVDVPALLRAAEPLGLGFPTSGATYFLGRDEVVLAPAGGMMRWRKRLFLFLSRNAESAGPHFGIPPERIIELGSQLAV